MSFWNKDLSPSFRLVQSVASQWSDWKGEVQHDFDQWRHRVEEVGKRAKELLSEPRPIVRALEFGPRLEFARLFRPDGKTARQVVASFGVPWGRFATRFTLKAQTGFSWPTAAHFESIFGFKFFSVGGSVGGSWTSKERMVTWFSRTQASVQQSGKNLYRLVLMQGKKELQKMIELKIFDPRLAFNQVGEAVAYQFSKPHFEAAYALLKEKRRELGAKAAAEYLKGFYPHIDADLVRKALLTPSRAGQVFLAEFATILGLNAALEKILSPGKFSHALEQGASYAVSNLFRFGVHVKGAWTLALAEAPPVVATHYLLSTLHEKAAEAFGWSRSTWRSLAIEDLGSLAVWAGLKTAIGGRLPSLGPALGRMVQALSFSPSSSASSAAASAFSLGAVASMAAAMWGIHRLDQKIGSWIGEEKNRRYAQIGDRVYQRENPFWLRRQIRSLAPHLMNTAIATDEKIAQALTLTIERF